MTNALTYTVDDLSNERTLEVINVVGDSTIIIKETLEGESQHVTFSHSELQEMMGVLLIRLPKNVH